MRMNRMKLPLIEAFPDFNSGGGIFDYLKSLSFVGTASTALSLNYDYYLNHSGYKQASPMVMYLVDTETLELDDQDVSQLALQVSIRYQAKWEQLYRRYFDLASQDFNLFSNVGLSTKTSYGKSVTETGNSSVTKSGSETSTIKGTETREETYPEARKSTRNITGGYTDTRDLTSVRTGTQDVTESYPTPRSVIKSISGGYSDTDNTASVRTGKQLVTDKGDISTATYGFNSTSGVKTQVVGPDTTGGTTTETDYGAGVKDEKSGAITRDYKNYQETSTESGSSKVSTTYGDTGLQDADKGDVTRVYNNYSDETVESGSKRLQIDYGNAGKTDTLTFDGRKDQTDSTNTVINSGEDEVTITGQKGVDNVSQYINLFENAYMLDFLEIVYNDLDNILTCPYYV